MGNAFGGSSPAQLGMAPTANAFNFPGYGTSAKGVTSGTAGLSQFNQPGALNQISNITQGLVNSPLGLPGMNMAAGVMGPAAATSLGALGLSGDLVGAAGGMIPQGQALANMGFDPQSQYYQMMLNKVIDAQNVQNALSGVSTTPYGQSVMGNTIGNFNLDWFNQQLQRALQGAGGEQQMFGAALGLGGGANQLGQAGATGAIQSALLPYGVQNLLGGQNLGYLNQLIGSGQQTAAIPQMQIGDYLQYMGAGQGAINAENAAQLAAAQFAANQEQRQYQNIASAAQGAGSLMAAPFTGGLSLLPGMFGGGMGGGMGLGNPFSMQTGRLY